jgi:hypothetical protein
MLSRDHPHLQGLNIFVITELTIATLFAWVLVSGQRAAKVPAAKERPKCKRPKSGQSVSGQRAAKVQSFNNCIIETVILIDCSY